MKLTQEQKDIVAEALQAQYAKLIEDAKDFDKLSAQRRAGSNVAESLAGNALWRRQKAEKVAATHKVVTS